MEKEAAQQQQAALARAHAELTASQTALSAERKLAVTAARAHEKRCKALLIERDQARSREI